MTEATILTFPFDKTLKPKCIAHEVQKNILSYDDMSNDDFVKYFHIKCEENPKLASAAQTAADNSGGVLTRIQASTLMSIML
jgi:hypothetical protein